MHESIQAFAGREVRKSQDNSYSGNIRSYFVLLALLYFVTRMVFCFLNEAEFTDAYILFNWSWDNPQKWHPLYPVLIQILKGLGSDPIIAGRTISSLCGIITLFGLWKLTREIYDLNIGLLSALLLIVSPQFLWANTRVLTESLFLAIGVGVILFTYRSLSEPNFWNAFWSIFLSGLAILTRPDGVIFLPCVLWSSIQTLRKLKHNGRNLILLLPALSSWFVFFIWIKTRPPESTYQSEFVYSLASSSPAKLLLYFVTYLENYPYALTYPLFFAAVFSISHLRIDNRRRYWLILLGYIHIVVFCVVTIHWSWSSRFLMLPLVLVLPESAFFLNEIKQKLKSSKWKILCTLIILFSLCFAFIGNYLQKDTYKDVRESSVYIRDHFSKAVIYSDETYKVPYYLQRDVKRYTAGQSFQEGDILVLHSFHTPLPKELAKISTIYDFRVCYVARARTMPVLTNSLLESITTNGQPITIVKRFEWQRFESIVIQIGNRKNLKLS